MADDLCKECKEKRANFKEDIWIFLNGQSYTRIITSIHTKLFNDHIYLQTKPTHGIGSEMTVKFCESEIRSAE